MGSAFSFNKSSNNVIPIGIKNGVNNIFTIPNDEVYRPTTLQVYLNGQLIRPESVTKNLGYTTFTLDPDHIPESIDVLTCSYARRSGSGNVQ